MRICSFFLSHIIINWIRWGFLTVKQLEECEYWSSWWTFFLIVWHVKDKTVNHLIKNSIHEFIWWWKIIPGCSPSVVCRSVVVVLRHSDPLSVSCSGSSVLQLPAWGQGALCEQPRREIPHQTAAPSAPAPRQWGESPNWPPPPPPPLSIHPSILPSINLSIPPSLPTFLPPLLQGNTEIRGEKGGDRHRKMRACPFTGQEWDSEVFMCVVFYINKL